MPTFTYTARDAKGELKTATIDAANREDVVQQLRRLRMNVVKVEEQSKSKQDASPFAVLRKLKID